jgi:hypothetical protein
MLIKISMLIWYKNNLNYRGKNLIKHIKTGLIRSLITNLIIRHNSFSADKIDPIIIHLDKKLL